MCIEYAEYMYHVYHTVYAIMFYSEVDVELCSHIFRNRQCQNRVNGALDETDRSMHRFQFFQHLRFNLANLRKK